jgi:uncharacterized membrane protein
MDLAALRSLAEVISLAIDGLGVLVIILGLARAMLRGVVHRGDDAHADGAYQRMRRDVGRGILLGLEFMVAGDIIRTVAVEPTLESLAVLGLIVLIRTFLSFSLEVELEGRWPWNRMAERRDEP